MTLVFPRADTGDHFDEALVIHSQTASGKSPLPPLFAETQREWEARKVQLGAAGFLVQPGGAALFGATSERAK